MYRPWLTHFGLCARPRWLGVIPLRLKKPAKNCSRYLEEHGLPLTHGTALACLGWATAQSDNISRGIRCLEEGLAMYNRLGLRTNLCLMICLLAEAYFVAGEYERGIQRVNLSD